MSSKLNRHGQRRAAPCLKSLEPQSTDLDERVRPRPATVRSSSEHRSSFRSGVLAAHLIVGPSPRLSLFALAALRLMCAVYVAHILLGLGGRDDQFWGVWVYEAIGLLAAAICLWRSFVGRSRRVWAAFGLAIFLANMGDIYAGRVLQTMQTRRTRPGRTPPTWRLMCRCAPA